MWIKIELESKRQLWTLLKVDGKKKKDIFVDFHNDNGVHTNTCFKKKDF